MNTDGSGSRTDKVTGDKDVAGLTTMVQDDGSKTKNRLSPARPALSQDDLECNQFASDKVKR